MDTVNKPFAYGTFVSGDNFTDREKETSDLLMNFRHGINTILISPRRMGKTSLVHKAVSLIGTDNIIPVFIDIYDCRDEYELYNRFSSAVIRAASSTIDAAIKTVAEFIGRVTPKISVSPTIENEYSISLGLTPRMIDPEEILNLPQRLAEKRGKHLLICIDEFQQIGEFADSLNVQKRMRGVWQCQQDVSYCLFGSKKHMLENIFQNRRMPFFQFGQMIYLGKISAEDWTSYIVSRFSACGKKITAELARKTCEIVECYSSYVQQLSWNVLVNAKASVSKEDIDNAVEDLISQNEPLYMTRIENLSSYQLNMLRAICAGVHSGFTSEDVLNTWNLGSKSNVTRIRTALIDKELIEKGPKGLFVPDPVFRLWFVKNPFLDCS